MLKVRCEEVFYLLLVVSCGSPRCSALLGDTTGRSLSVGAVGGKINVLLGTCPHVEGGNVNELVSNADMALFDKDASMVNALGQSLLVDLGLKATFQELLSGKLENEIKFELVIRQQAVAAHAPEEGSSLEDALGILGVQSQEGTSCLSKLGESKLDAPDLSLASESILSDKFELGIETFLLKRTTGRLEGGAVCNNMVKE